MISAQIREVLELQKHYTSKNTPEMQRRGVLIRKDIAKSLEAQIDRLKGTYENAIDDLWIQGKDGDGNKAVIPWVRLSSKSLSPSATQGWYVVFLISANGASCNLSLGHASTSHDDEAMERRYQRVLTPEVAANLMAWGKKNLQLDKVQNSRLQFEIDLEAKGGLGAAYERTSLCGFVYPKENIPSDEQIFSDVEYLLTFLSKLYELQETDPAIPGAESPEHKEAVAAIDAAAGRDYKAPKKQGRNQMSSADKKLIEERAVAVAIGHLKELGYTSIKDVGATHSYDLDASLNGESHCIEVKGTMSLGDKVVLTRNEIFLHRQEFPRNGLLVVSEIKLEKSEVPKASGGVIRFIPAWKIEDEDLSALGYDYVVPKK
jgi:hypothetical protein